MDLILFTITQLKQVVDKIKSIFSFIRFNYLPDIGDVKNDFWIFLSK